MKPYRLLFRIDVTHEFFADRICRGIDFVPLPETASLIARRGMLLRSAPGAVAVYREDVSHSAAGSQADDRLAFTFRIRATDASFWNYTDPDGAPPDTVFVFDSDRAVADAEGAGFRLHRGAWAAAADRLQPSAPGLREVLDARDVLVPPLAIVTIRTGAREPGGEAEGRSYLIAFQARRTHWKYYVLGTEATDSPPSIRDADGLIEFQPGAADRLPDNRQALTLRSTAPIALHERPPHRFQLRAKTQGGERVLVKRLAAASPNHLGKETVDGREILVSEIYVNL